MKNYMRELRDVVGTRPLILPGATVLLFNSQNEVLLEKRKDDGKWGLPGGMMEPGETFEQVALREIHEETGLNIHSLRLYHVFSGHEYYHRYPNGDEVFNCLAAFVCKHYSGQLERSEESEDLVYYSLDNLPEMSNISGKVLEHYKNSMEEKKGLTKDDHHD